MKLFYQKLALAVAVLLVCAQPAFSQNYPLPGSDTQSPVLCTGCSGNNASGQPNSGLKTWPYGDPLVDHVGRLVDSTEVTEFQGQFRTARSRKVMIARETRGSAPPRVYVQIGSALTAYSLDRFFSSELPSGISPISTVVGYAVSRGNYPNEKVLKWDAWVYPEAKGNTAWETPAQDGQDRLYDFDIDDRGNVYLAMGAFGFGIAKDTGQMNNAQLQKMAQKLNTDFGGPTLVISLKVGAKYYAVISDGQKGRSSMDVTNATSPGTEVIRTGSGAAFYSYAKDDEHQRLAVVTGNKTLEIYDYSSYVNGGGPIETYEAGGRKWFKDVAVDEDGNFWTAESSARPENNNVVKFARGTSGYTKRSFNVFGENFTPSTWPSGRTVNYGDKYLTFVGKVSVGSTMATDVKLFRIDGGEPVLVPLNDYFRNYYHYAPFNYAQPPSGELNIGHGAHPVKWNGKTYLIYSTSGLGDVYELRGGDSIIGSRKSGHAGTANPYSAYSGTGPVYGDILKFTSKSSNTANDYVVSWDFDNTDSGTTNNKKTAQTGQDVLHQFTGLNTTAKVTATRHVKVSATDNPEMSDTVDVTFDTPTARILLWPADTLVAPSDTPLGVVAGDSFADASDGSVESHYASWKIDSTTTNSKPDELLPVGDFGPHSVTLDAKYGQYDASFNTEGSPYVTSVSNLDYEVRPFVASFRTPATTTTSVTFKGAGTKSTLPSVITATQWTVEWSLKSSGGSDIVDPFVSTVALGTVPDFVIADKSSIVSGSVLKLKISVNPIDLIAGAANYASHEISQTLITPDPKITQSGCGHVGDPCTFTASSLAGNSMSDWTVKWTLKRGSTVVDSETGTTFTPNITAADSYTVSVAASTKLFESTATKNITVDAPLCGNAPTAGQVWVTPNCDTCDVGQQVTLSAESLTYTFQGCEQYVWSFGDGQSATTAVPDVKHTYGSAKTWAGTLVIKKGSESSPSISFSVKVGTTQEPPPCTAPSNIKISYLGSKGCAPGTACKTGESIKFTALRGTAPLANCDTASWTFGDGATSSTKSPSKGYSTTGTFTVNVTITNTSGSATGTPVNIQVVPDGGGTCSTGPKPGDIYIEYRGANSGCSSENATPCQKGENITFTALNNLGYNFQACDKYEWNFGDGSALATVASTQHAYTGAANSYRASLRVYNQVSTTGTTVQVDVPFGNISVKPTPVLSYVGFQTTGAKGSAVTFRVNVTNAVSATGWAWDFGDGTKDNTHTADVGVSATVTHTFAKTGTFTVTVKARNAEDVNTAPVGIATGQIKVDDVPEYKYLLPVVVHGGGQNNSVWRTDVQIYNPDPKASVTNPLLMTASFNHPLVGTLTQTLSIRQSTYSFEDFMNIFTVGLDPNASGPVTLTVKGSYAPQIWTRTYNQAENGTFGQFIPAIRLDNAGGGSAMGEGRYYLSGLKHDARYRTNMGLVNPNVQAINATISLYDDQNSRVGTSFTRTLQPFQLDQFSIGSIPEVKDHLNRPFSVEVEVPSGQWVIAYASFIDGGSNDPVFLQAVRASELQTADLRNIVMPGVGHTGAWRSDVTIFNSDSHQVNVDLAYHDGAGEKRGEALSVPIPAGEFLHYDDLLKQGVLGDVPDGLGILRITVPPTETPERFPMAFARTYNDDGSGRTFGQGISAFAASRANVAPGKPALIPAIRSTDKYYTNVFATNVTSTDANITIKALDPNTGAEAVIGSYTVKPNQTLGVVKVNIASLPTASLKIETTGGSVWAFASIVDQGTKDPEYVPATPLVP